MDHRTRTESNLVKIDPLIDDNQTMIYLGTPSHTTTPYDTYARMIVKDARIAFARASIPAEVLACHRRIARVGAGSGPGGAVRFGDDMLPPDVQAIVTVTNADRARQVWADYQKRKYIPKPFSIFDNRWFDRNSEVQGSASWFGAGGSWVKGGAWIKVILNAIVIAEALGRKTERLEAYRARPRGGATYD